MRRRRRAAPLSPDRGLQARMVLALLLPPLVTFGGVAATILFLRTHPSLEQRVARLERLEQALHAAGG